LSNSKRVPEVDRKYLTDEELHRFASAIKSPPDPRFPRFAAGTSPSRSLARLSFDTVSKGGASMYNYLTQFEQHQQIVNEEI